MAAEITTSIVISMGGVLQRVKWRCRTVRWFGLEIYVYIKSWGCPCKKLGVSFYEDPHTEVCIPLKNCMCNER